MHVMIGVHIQIGIFSYAMVVMYLAWISPETVKHLPDNVKQRFGRRDRRLERRPASSAAACDQPTSPALEDP